MVKIGGHALDSLSPSSALLADLAHDIAQLASDGVEVALVHGGGPQIEELLETARVESRFHEGLRITDTLTMSYVAMALGHVNLLITAAMNHAGLACVGLSGADASLFSSTSLGEPWQRAGAARVQVRRVQALAEQAREQEALLVRGLTADDRARVLAGACEPRGGCG